MKKIKIFLAFMLFLHSCWSERSSPDTKFMRLIEQQALLDSSLKTEVIVYPKKINLGIINKTQKIEGSFWIKNIGIKDFNLVSLRTDCKCCTTDSIYQKSIYPQDSLEVKYYIDIQSEEKYMSHSIVIVGNCQYGNQTFIVQAFINR